MKKLIAVLLVLILALSLAACGGSKDGGSKDSGSSSTEATTTGQNSTDEQNSTAEQNTDEITTESSSSASPSSLSVGDIYTFGTYEQDNNTSNGKEAIEWQVLAVEDGKALLISKYALGCLPFNSGEAEDTTWEKCTLRTWLNGDFLNEAFDSGEQSRIILTTVTADKNPNYDISPGNDTNDKVFLLSTKEASQYFESNDARMCAPTDYALAQGGAFTSDDYKVDGKAACWWWLRTPGRLSSYMANVDYTGLIRGAGEFVGVNRGTIRPALWISF